MSVHCHSRKLAHHLLWIANIYIILLLKLVNDVSAVVGVTLSEIFPVSNNCSPLLHETGILTNVDMI